MCLLLCNSKSFCRIPQDSLVIRNMSTAGTTAITNTATTLVGVSELLVSVPAEEIDPAYSGVDEEDI